MAGPGLGTWLALMACRLMLGYRVAGSMLYWLMFLLVLSGEVCERC